MRIEEAGGGFDNASDTIVGFHLVQFALGTGENSGELQSHVLGLHVDDKGVGEALGLAGLDGVVVLHGRQVANDALVGGRSFGEGLRGSQDAGKEGDLNG